MLVHNTAILRYLTKVHLGSVLVRVTRERQKIAAFFENIYRDSLCRCPLGTEQYVVV